MGEIHDLVRRAQARSVRRHCRAAAALCHLPGRDRHGRLLALAAIATAYRLAGLALDLRDSQLAPVVEGVTRTLGSRPRRQAVPVVPELLRAMIAQCAKDEIFRAALAARGRAMLLLGLGTIYLTKLVSEFQQFGSWKQHTNLADQ